MSEDSPIYYRIMKSKTEGLIAVCMQWFDEYDCDQSRLVNDKKYESEDEAKTAIKVMYYDAAEILGLSFKTVLFKGDN
jgi:hypothetical protein